MVVQRQPAETPLCPSATGRTEDARIIGFIGPDGVVANITTPIRVTPEILETVGPQPERMFRLSAPCAKSGCRHWQSEACALVGRVREEVGRQIPVDPKAKLADCAIRPNCVWWRQTGPDACRVCPHVIYNPAA